MRAFLNWDALFHFQRKIQRSEKKTMSKRKLGLAILTALLCVCMAMFLVACGTQGEKGEQGEAGADGISIVSVEKVDSEGLTDTYKITYSDGNSTTFTVTNGKDGADGSDGEDGTSITDVDVNDAGELVIYLDGEPVNLGKIVGENGQNGEDGKDGRKRCRNRRSND